MGSFAAVDPFYNDNAMFFGWQRKGINFVSRAKDDMSHAVSENLEVPQKEKNQREGKNPGPTSSPTR
ncbi:MAG: hypothetical protein LBL95_10090 [Deltaproteobacteria bacterium]|jgi:hypothetical protein|nr:hypothetical protein [Deltaproteobacteria bacterium]